MSEPAENCDKRGVVKQKRDIFCQRSNPKKGFENEPNQSQSICNLTFVGLLVGAEVGPGVGACVGPGVGLSVGTGVGASVGLLVGSPGVTVGISVGDGVGLRVGDAVVGLQEHKIKEHNVTSRSCDYVRGMPW